MGGLAIHHRPGWFTSTTLLTMGGLDPPIQLHAPAMPAGFVYILASNPHGTLYIGVTSKLLDRMEQHRRGVGSAFVKKYGVTRLVYFEEYPLYTDAIRRETSLNRWKRDWKIALIEKVNPEGGTVEPWMAGSEAGHGEVGTPVPLIWFNKRKVGWAGQARPWTNSSISLRVFDLIAIPPRSVMAAAWPA